MSISPLGDLSVFPPDVLFNNILKHLPCVDFFHFVSVSKSIRVMQRTDGAPVTAYQLCSVPITGSEHATPSRTWMQLGAALVNNSLKRLGLGNFSPFSSVPSSIHPMPGAERYLEAVEVDFAEKLIDFYFGASKNEEKPIRSNRDLVLRIKDPEIYTRCIQKLTSLNLEYFKVSSKFLKGENAVRFDDLGAQLTNIKHLNIDLSEKFISLSKITNWKGLERLQITLAGTDSAQLHLVVNEVAELKSLKFLQLEATESKEDITPFEIGSFKELTTLKSLCLKNIKFGYLDSSPLVNLTNLTSLNFQNACFSGENYDALLQPLTSLQSLSDVYFSKYSDYDTRLIQKSVYNFLMKRPGVTVHRAWKFLPVPNGGIQLKRGDLSDDPSKFKWFSNRPDKKL